MAFKGLERDADAGVVLFKVTIDDVVFLNAIHFNHLRISMLEFRAESKLGRTELLELRRLRDLWSLGLSGLRPDWRAKRFRISVREMTPVKRPDIRAPGREAAETAGKTPVREGDAGFEDAGEECTACAMDGVASGVAGAVGEGDADSTTHIRCDLVATSFATV